MVDRRADLLLLQVDSALHPFPQNAFPGRPAGSGAEDRTVFKKGAKDRFTVLAEGVIPALREHLASVRLTHQEDLAAGYVRGGLFARGLGSEVNLERGA